MAVNEYLSADKVNRTAVSTANPLPVFATGVDIPVSSVGTITSVASSATAVVLLPARPNRKGAAVFNASTASLYITLSDQTPSATQFTHTILTNTYYEVPFRYTGVIGGIWVSANGAALMTEFY